MRPFVIFLVVCIAFFAWFSHIFKSGKLQKYLDERPNPSWGVRLQYYMGQYYYFRKEREKSLGCADRVLKVYPKSPFVEHALFLRAKCLQELKKKEEAAEAYKKFFETYPKSPKVRVAEKRYRRLIGYE